MHHISHLSQFNLRSTMPTFPTRNHKRNGNERVEKSQAFSSNTLMQKNSAQQSNLTSFFVRITKENLEEQNRIYKWRMNCSGNFIGVENIKLQSEGNRYNPNYLFKVDLSISKSNFVQVKDLCLTKCVSLLKAVLNGAKVLLEYFEPIVFTEKMIYISQNGSAKVWMDQRFYVNPNNELYYKRAQYLTVEDSLRSILAIFQSKCLKTKLSTKMFKILSQKFTIQGALLAIQNFQSEQNLFPIQGLKNSISTGTAINTSFSIQFSINKSSIKKKEKNQRSDNFLALRRQKKIGNIASHKFIQARSMELIPVNFSLPKKEKQTKIIYKSQQQKGQSIQRDDISKSKTILEDVKQKKINNSTFSITSSQMFNECGVNAKPVGKEKISQISQVMDNKDRLVESEKFESASFNSIKKAQKITQSCNLQNQSAKNPQVQNAKVILSKNGWSANILTLFDRKNLKQSFSEGKDQNLYLRDFKLKKLHTMAKELTESFLPVHEEPEQI